MPFKVEVDKKLCIGCGACVAVCDNFEVVEEEVDGSPKNIAKPKEEQVNEEGCNSDAVETCPVQAIKILKV